MTVSLWLQWLLVAAVALLLWRWLKHSPALPLVLGLVALWALRGIVGHLKLLLIAHLIDLFFPVAAVGLVVLFQPELRAALLQLNHRLSWLDGIAPWLGRRRIAEENASLPVICEALELLAQHRVGALVVLAGSDPLEPLISHRVELDARITRELIVSLFVTDRSGIPDLHDGALVVEGDRCRWAGAVLPLTQQPVRRLGTRHRAAIGITERSDAVALVVSESGRISAAVRGRLYPLPPRMRLLEHVQNLMSERRERVTAEA